MKFWLLSELALISMVISIAGSARAEVADVIPVGGVLTDLDGQALDGDYDMLFGLYETQTGGTAFYSDEFTGANQVIVEDGLFSVELTFSDDEFLDVVEAADLWLGITVGADSEADRIHIGTVPFALEARYCHTVLDSTCPEGQYLRGWDETTGDAICEEQRITLPVGGTHNCRLDLTGSTLSIVGSDGNPLSASNACVVRITDSETATFTAPVSATFGVSSETDGNSFGTTAGVAWDSVMPMFLHGCDGSASPYFGFSRNPARQSTGSVETDLCQKDNDDCDDQNDILLLTSGLTLADEVGHPCATVGSFRAEKDSSDAWSVASLVGGQDGFGVFQEGTKFVLPMGQNGAAAGTYVWVHGGGTAPTYTGASTWNTYVISRSGIVQMEFNYQNETGGISGAGSNLYVVTPYSSASATMVPAGTAISWEETGTSQWDAVAWVHGRSISIWYGSSGSGICGDDQSSESRQLNGRVVFSAF